MNLQHERLLSLCETLNLPFIAQGYAAAAQEAVRRETAYGDFLEEFLKAEARGRQVRRQGMLTRLAGFPAIKTLEDFDCDFAAGVKRSQIDELAGRGRALYSDRRTWCWLAPPGLARPISPSRWAIERRRRASRPASPPPPISCLPCRWPMRRIS